MSAPDDETMRVLWRSFGGEFHGPNVETGTMPEAKLLPFLRHLLASGYRVGSEESDQIQTMLMAQSTARLKRIRELEAQISDDTKRLDWAEKNPGAFRQAMAVDWANAGSGFREAQFNWRGTIDYAIKKQSEQVKK